MLRKLTKINTVVLVVIIAALAWLGYSYGLAQVPVHLNQDELEFSLNAYSISHTLHDSYGNFLPFYFKHLDTFWATPVIVYFTSLFLKFLPLSEAVIRLPSVTVAVISIVLIAVLGKMIFKSNLYVIFGALLAAGTPALFINSRLLLDNIYPIAFVLLWLIFLKRYFERRTPWLLVISGLALGVGFHSYHAAKVMMPIYYLMSLAYLFFEERRKFFKPAAFLTLGFIIPIMVFLPWLKQHPDTITSQVSYVSGIDKSINSNQGYLGILNPARFPSFLASYGTYFSPGILFVTGDRSLIHSTRESGAFLFPVIFLLVFGILNVVFKKVDGFSKLVLLGFLTFPIAPSLINDPERISRGLIVIPFVALLALYGIELLAGYKDRVFRFMLYGIFVLSLLQFIGFSAFYFGEYRNISYGWFNYDIGGAFESALRSTQIRPVKALYIDSSIPFASRYLTFYATKLKILPNIPVNYFDAKKDNFLNFPTGSLAVIPTWDFSTRDDRVGAFTKIEIIREPDGTESFTLFYRD